MLLMHFRMSHLHRLCRHRLTLSTNRRSPTSRQTSCLDMLIATGLWIPRIDGPFPASFINLVVARLRGNAASKLWLRIHPQRQNSSALLTLAVWRCACAPFWTKLVFRSAMPPSSMRIIKEQFLLQTQGNLQNILATLISKRLLYRIGLNKISFSSKRSKPSSTRLTLPPSNLVGNLSFATGTMLQAV